MPRSMTHVSVLYPDKEITSSFTKGTQTAHERFCLAPVTGLMQNCTLVRERERGRVYIEARTHFVLLLCIKWLRGYIVTCILITSIMHVLNKLYKLVYSGTTRTSVPRNQLQR